MSILSLLSRCAPGLLSHPGRWGHPKRYTKMTSSIPTGTHSNIMRRNRAPAAELLPQGVLQGLTLSAACFSIYVQPPGELARQEGRSTRHLAQLRGLDKLSSRTRALLPALHGNGSPNAHS